MKKLKVTLLMIVSFILFGCGALSTETCHVHAKIYVIEKGFSIDTAYFSKFQTTILTKDSAVILVKSFDLTAPYVSEMKLIRNY